MSERPYKILGIAAGRTMGNAEVLLRESLMEFERLALAETRIVRLRQLDIKGFSGELDFLQDAVQGGDGVLSEDDDFEWLKEQVLWADAIVFSACAYRYMPPSEVIVMMNRALGAGRRYVAACRANPKLVGLMVVGGTNTMNYNLPLQYNALNAMCRGFELVDQFYANWIRGKGYVAFQDHHLARSRQLAKRIFNKLEGYAVPEIKTRIMKLNPMEHSDDKFINLEGCPVCHSTVVHIVNDPFTLGKFTCSICGAKGRVEHHGGDLTYVWDDDSIAHNRLHVEHDAQTLEAFARAHAPLAAEKQTVPEFPVLTSDNDPAPAKPRILALVAGPKGGTSELLARKALAAATRDGRFEGAILRLLDYRIDGCLGCLVCKVNKRFRAGIDECILKDDDRWVVGKLLESSAALFSVDAVNGFTYGQVVALIQRFGVNARIGENAPMKNKRAWATIVSSFDDEVNNATYATGKLGRYFCNPGLKVAEELLPNVPIVGDGILANASALDRAANVGRALGTALSYTMAEPPLTALVPKRTSVCPSCGLDMVELRSDMTVACAECDAEGEFQHIFGENDIVWNDYSVKHSRVTPFGVKLHIKHTGFSQADDRDMLNDPEVIAQQLAPYIEFGKIVMPESGAKSAAWSEEERTAIEKIVFSYPGEERFSLAIMQDIQKAYGYVPKQALPLMAEHLKVKRSQLYSTATFYKALNLDQKGRHVIRVCDGTACHMGGSRVLIEQIEELLGIEPGQTTQDGLFSLELVKHVGSCALAPVMLVDDVVYNQVTLDELECIIEEYRAMESDAVKEGELS